MGSESTKGRTVMDVGDDGVAVITIINPPVNSLSPDVLKSFQDTYSQALQWDDVKAIVVTGAKGRFSGGFDIMSFERFQAGNSPAPKLSVISVEILADTVEEELVKSWGNTPIEVKYSLRTVSLDTSQATSTSMSASDESFVSKHYNNLKE